MKRTAQILFVGVVALCCQAIWAQHTPQLDARIREEAEADPLIFSFAPDYNAKEEAERAELAAQIARIDTLDISEARKYRLIRDLYSKRESKRLQKAFQPQEPELAEEPPLDP